MHPIIEIEAPRRHVTRTPSWGKVLKSAAFAIAIADCHGKVEFNHPRLAGFYDSEEQQNQATTKGQLTNRLTGIQGVAAGGNAQILPKLNCRVHGVDIQFTAVNYTNPTVALVGAGTYNATLTPVLTNGRISSVTIAVAGSGMTNGTYTSAGGGVTITDPTGIGAQLTVTVAGGAVTAVVVASGGTPGPINPALAATFVRITVSSQTVINVLVSELMAIQQANGYQPQFGTLAIFFTEPWRNMLRDNTVNSWDLLGQSSFEIDVQMNSTLTNPGLAGVYHFDFARNAHKATNGQIAAGVLDINGNKAVAGSRIPFISPIAKSRVNQAVAVGPNSITVIPTKYPINRVWFYGSNPGNLYALQVQADGVILLDCTAQQLYEMYSANGFQIGSTFTAPQAGGGYTGNTVILGGLGGNNSGGPYQGELVPTTVPNGQLYGSFQNSGLVGSSGLGNGGPFPFDLAWIQDRDQRPWNNLSVKTLVVTVWSLVAQNLSMIVETTPGQYNS